MYLQYADAEMYSENLTACSHVVLGWNLSRRLIALLSADVWHVNSTSISSHFTTNRNKKCSICGGVVFWQLPDFLSSRHTILVCSFSASHSIKSACVNTSQLEN